MYYFATLHRVFRVVLIGAVAVATPLYIALILGWEGNHFAIRLLSSAVVLALLSGCGLGCGTLRERIAARAVPIRLPLLPESGVIAALVSAVLYLIGIWASPDYSPFWDFYWRATTSTLIVAIAAAILSLMYLARLAKSFEWAQTVAMVAVFGLAGTILQLIWSEYTDPITFKIVGVLMVLTLALSILIPVFHRLSQPGAESAETPTLPLDDGSPLSSLYVALEGENLYLRKRVAELEARIEQGEV